ncbi:unnamed protein product [Eretmochelys imbricata]
MERKPKGTCPGTGLKRPTSPAFARLRDTARFQAPAGEGSGTETEANATTRRSSAQHPHQTAQGSCCQLRTRLPPFEVTSLKAAGSRRSCPAARTGAQSSPGAGRGNTLSLAALYLHPESLQGQG